MERKSIRIFLLLAFLALFLTGTTAQADTLFSEALTSSLGKFTSSGSASVASTGVTLRGATLSSSRGAITSSAISTVGYTGITLSFNRVTYGLDTGEAGIAEVSVNGGSFTAVESTKVTSAGTVTLSLGTSAANASSVVIRFRANANSSLEYYRVKTVVVSGTSSGGGTSTGTLPAVSSIEADGPYAVTIDKSTGPGRSGWVARPTTLGSLGATKHPIFVWGPGAGSDQSDYEDHLRRWASHGFVVYSETSTGDGSEMTAAITWLISQNGTSSSKYYNKLDTTKIAIGGHSRGSLSAFGIAGDSRLTTTLHVAGGSFDGNGPSALRKPALYIVGTEDTMALPNVQTDYTNTKVPVWFGVMSGVDHMSAARQGLPVTTAWLRWQLAGETSRKSMFVSSGCYFCSGMWTAKYKNW